MAKGQEDQPQAQGAESALEVEYERIFGQRRFSEYDSFRESVTTKKSTGV